MHLERVAPFFMSFCKTYANISIILQTINKQGTASLPVDLPVMTVSIFLDSVTGKDGSKYIMFAVSIQGQRKRISSGIRVLPDHWDGRYIRESIHEPLAEEKNNLLALRKSCFSKIEKYAEVNEVPITHELVRTMYDQMNKRESKAKELPQKIENQFSFRLLVDQLKEHNKARWSEGKARQLKQVVDAVERFKPNTKIGEINEFWLNDYCHFLVSEGKENSTIKQNHLKNIKVVCAFASKKLGIKMSDDVEYFTWKDQRKQYFTPTAQEVSKIMVLTDLSKSQEHIRDTFIVSCFTGLRESDVREIQSEMMEEQNGQKFLRVSMKKTNLDYSIPITQEVWDILQKYNFRLPRYTQQNYNLVIKEVAKRATKGTYIKYRFEGNKKIKKVKQRHQMFTTHTGRRFFGRNWIDRGGSLVILMKIFGHSSIETTLKYIGYQPEEITKEFQKVMMGA